MKVSKGWTRVVLVVLILLMSDRGGKCKALLVTNPLHMHSLPFSIRQPPTTSATKPLMMLPSLLDVWDRLILAQKSLVSCLQAQSASMRGINRTTGAYVHLSSSLHATNNQDSSSSFSSSPENSNKYSSSSSTRGQQDQHNEHKSIRDSLDRATTPEYLSIYNHLKAAGQGSNNKNTFVNPTAMKSSSAQQQQQHYSVYTGQSLGDNHEHVQAAISHVANLTLVHHQPRANTAVAAVQPTDSTTISSDVSSDDDMFQNYYTDHSGETHVRLAQQRASIDWNKQRLCGSDIYTSLQHRTDMPHATAPSSSTPKRSSQAASPSHSHSDIQTFPSVNQRLSSIMDPVAGSKKHSTATRKPSTTPHLNSNPTRSLFEVMQQRAIEDSNDWRAKRKASFAPNQSTLRPSADKIVSRQLPPPPTTKPTVMIIDASGKVLTERIRSARQQAEQSAESSPAVYGDAAAGNNVSEDEVEDADDTKEDASENGILGYLKGDEEDEADEEEEVGLLGRLLRWRHSFLQKKRQDDDRDDHSTEKKQVKYYKATPPAEEEEVAVGSDEPVASSSKGVQLQTEEDKRRFVEQVLRRRSAAST